MLAIQVDLTPGVAKYVSPGSTVDMFVTYSGTSTSSGSSNSSGGQNAQALTSTKLFASGVLVRSVTPATDTATSGSSTSRHSRP